MWAHVHYQQDGAGARPGLVRERAGRPPADAAGRWSHAVRLVLDTNTAVSGLLWGGWPGRLIDAAC